MSSTPEMPLERRNDMHRSKTIALLVCYDLLAMIAAIILAVLLRYDHLHAQFLLHHAQRLTVMIGIFIVSFYVAQLYRSHWQYAGLESLWAITRANLIAAVVTFLWQHTSEERIPASILAISTLLTIGLVGGQRALMRARATRPTRRRESRAVPLPDEPKRTVILGGGNSAVEVLAALRMVGENRYDVIGILDEDPRFHGTLLRGIRILGGPELLHDLLRRHDVDEVLIAPPYASAERCREYVLACCREKIAVRVVPVITELLDNPAASQGRLSAGPISVDDLLHRSPAELDLEVIGHCLQNKRILVTGAGGSIGSELCRQICRFQPEQLVLLGHGENTIFSIERELARAFPALANRLVPVIADIRDEKRIDAVFTKYQPQIVYHAAAHKHIPLMEGNVCDGIANNVGGSRTIIRACTRHAVERMVLISTDKAVNPSSVVGATKFLSEEYARAETQHSPTCFVSVRFGNVLGSRGSVLPIFHEQIMHGGPVTITHPEMQRYFMTIPEASSLVLEAGAFGNPGDLFVLDMGNPVRIIDLAEDVIRLAGLEPYRDIDINCCGVRPGEKLSEELFTASEERIASSHDRLFVVNRPQYLDPKTLDAKVDALLAVAAQQHDSTALALLAATVPTFQTTTKSLTLT